jgi:hypothetical protein
MQGFISRFKEENRSLLLNAQTLRELQQVVVERIIYHNSEGRHSRTNYLARLTYLENLRSHCWQRALQGVNTVQLLGCTTSADGRL